MTPSNACQHGHHADFHYVADCHHVSLLGEFKVEKEGRRLDGFSTRKTAGLFAYLCYHADYRHPRELLIDQFWPESHLHAGRQSLSQALSSLRRLLEPIGVKPGSVIQSDRFQVWLAPGSVATDVSAFGASLDHAMQLEEPESRAAAFESAARRWKGALLPGFYDRWIPAEQERLSARFARACEEWIEDLRRNGKPNDAVAVARRFLPDELPLVLLPTNSPAAISPAAISPAAMSTSPMRAARLPFRDSPIYGRDKDLAYLARLLAPDRAAGEDRSRFVTITGASGVGKTRLALEIAYVLAGSYEEAVWFVSLADVVDVSQVDAAIGKAIAAQEEQVPSVERQIERLGDRPLLLVLDNFEHLVDGGCPLLAKLLERFPHLAVLVTSQRVLAFKEEWEYPLAPLAAPLPDADSEALRLCPSVALFLDRARRARSELQLTDANASCIGRLCARLEGIPLALELAAGRAGLLTPAQILKELDQPLDFLASRQRDIPDRHRTLRAALEWSLALLPEDALQFLTRLAICRGGWPLDLAAHLAPEGIDPVQGLDELRHYSLIRAEESDGEMRYRMLELVREYMGQRASQESLLEAEDRHSDWIERQLKIAGDRESSSSPLRRRLADDRSNIRSAVSSRLDGSAVPGMELAILAADFWMLRGSPGESLEIIQMALGRAFADEPSDLSAKLHAMAGYVLLWLGRFDEGALHYERALEFWREMGDTRAAARSFSARGSVAYFRGQVGIARGCYEHARDLFLELGDMRNLACILNNLALATSADGDHETARRLLLESREAWSNAGESRPLPYSRFYMATILARQQSLEEAGRHCWEGIRAAEAEGRLLEIAAGLETLALIASQSEHLRTAARLLGAAEALRQELETPSTLVEDAEREEIFASDRSKVGEAITDQEWREGFERPWAETLALATGLPGSDPRPYAPISAGMASSSRT